MHPGIHVGLALSTLALLITAGILNFVSSQELAGSSGMILVSPLATGYYIRGVAEKRIRRHGEAFKWVHCSAFRV